MKISLWSIVAGIALISSGCSDGMIVVREIDAKAPTFTVIPVMTGEVSSDPHGRTFRALDVSGKDLEFAAKVENLIAAQGFKVYERPAFKYHSETAAGKDAVETRQVETVDYVNMLPEAKADLVAVTYYESGRVRIIRRDDSTLVATLSSGGQSDLFEDKFRTALAGLMKDPAHRLLCRMPQ